MEDIEDATMRGIRYLDKLIDELAKGNAMEKIPRKPWRRSLPTPDDVTGARAFEP